MEKKIRLAVIGLGQRGYSMLDTFLNTGEFDIVALCDDYQDRVDKANTHLKEKGQPEAKEYLDFEKLLRNKDIDACYIATSWEAHIHQAIRAMEEHIPVGMEVGGAYDIKDCWNLVNAYEKTKTPIMMMENCCYDRFELLSTNLARKGLLGDVVFAHGAYSHDLRNEITGGNVNRHYRLRNYIARNCENYPTHELGPIARLLNINRGNRLVSISSFATPSKGLEQFTYDSRCPDPSLKGTKFHQGDVITTVLTCENGEIITMTLDTTLPTYYSRDFIIKGTKGMTKQEADMVLLDGKYSEAWQPDPSIFLSENAHNAVQYQDYLPKYWREITDEEKRTGHGGMDLLMLKEFAKALKNHTPMPIDVYDAAAWYSITPLSAKSILNGKPYKIPDFTRGKYKIRTPEDVVEFDLK